MRRFRIFRWNYIAPRLVVLFLLLCFSEVGAGWLAEWAAESHGSQAVGARIDIASSKASLINTRLSLSGIEVANPDAPTTNLFEAELLDLDFDTAAALRKKLVVKQGLLRGLHFGGERETSGALESNEPETDDAPLAVPEWAGSAAAEQAEQWLSNLRGRLSDDAIEGLHSPVLAEQLQAEWPRRAAELRASVDELKTRIAALKEEIDQAKKNPLRGLETLRQAPAEIAELMSEATRLRRELAAFPQQAAADRQRIADARQHDERLIRERLNVENLDPETVSAYLIGEQLGGPIGKLIETLRWARGMMPAGGETEPLAPSRGVPVLFPGCRKTPDLLVEKLDITGFARVADRPVELVGALSNFTTQPVVHGQPMNLTLTAAGGLPFDLRATIDRTGPQPRDTVVVDCRALPLPSMRLGKTDWLSLETEPATASLAIDLSLVGDTLTGDVRLIQDKFAVRSTADLQDASPLEWSIAESLVSSLSRTPRVETTVNIAGSLDTPEYRFDSTIGPVVARAMRGAVQQAAASQAETLLADSRGRVEKQLAKLDETVASVTNDLTTRLREQTGLLDKFAKLLPAGETPLSPAGVLGVLPGVLSR